MWIPPISSHPFFSTEGGVDVAVVGIEAHICVAQTALDLMAAGHRVHVLADGVSSGHPGELAAALARLRAAGASVTTSEAWLYEVLGDAAAPEFKGLVGLVKESAGATRGALGGWWWGRWLRFRGEAMRIGGAACQDSRWLLLWHMALVFFFDISLY